MLRAFRDYFTRDYGTTGERDYDTRKYDSSPKKSTRSFFKDLHDVSQKSLSELDKLHDKQTKEFSAVQDKLNERLKCSDFFKEHKSKE